MKTKWKRYLFLDFETANATNDSPCQIAFTLVEDSKIIYQYNQLVNPETSFSYWNIQIHHITHAMIRDQATFPTIWKEIKHYFDNQTLVIAHNAVFDMRVLHHTLRRYQLEIPTFSYACSVYLSRKVTNSCFPSYSLGRLAESLDINFNHHDASADAQVIYEIFLKLKPSVDDLVREAILKGYQVKTFSLDGY